MKVMKRMIALLLVLLAVSTSFFGCSSKGEEMMELDGETITVNMFSLYLSRMKGNLCSAYGYGSEALDDSFWDKIMSPDGTTYNEFYTEQVLESAKTYLAALYVFEEKGLKLPDSYVDAVDEELLRLIEEDADGSKNQLNAILAEYGANYDVLREVYLVEKKISYLKESLFGANGSLIAENLIEDYYQQTYARFKQVFLYTYDYKYETDGDGQDIYYAKDGRVAYDTSKTPKTDSAGNPVRDKNGDQIYINEDGKVAYDITKGTRKNVIAEDGSALVESLTGEALDQVRLERDQIYAKVVESDFTGFDKLVETYSLDAGMEKYPNGYYMTATTNYDSPEVVKKLFELEVGEAAWVESQYGYHIIMRYELNEGGYADSANSDFFVSTTNGSYVFMTDLQNQLMSEYLKQFKDQIVLDEKLFGEVDIKSVGANFYY